MFRDMKYSHKTCTHTVFNNSDAPVIPEYIIQLYLNFDRKIDHSNFKTEGWHFSQ